MRRERADFSLARPLLEQLAAARKAFRILKSAGHVFALISESCIYRKALPPFRLVNFSESF